MRHATLPADAGIGSNDREALERAERADERVTSVKKPIHPPSPAIKSTRAGSGRSPKGGFIEKFKGM